MIAVECTVVDRILDPARAPLGHVLVPRRHDSPSGTFIVQSAAARLVTVDAAEAVAQTVERHVRTVRPTVVPPADRHPHAGRNAPRVTSEADAAMTEADEVTGNHRHGPEVDLPPQTESATDGAARQACAGTGEVAAAAIVVAEAEAEAAAAREDSARTPKTAATVPTMIDTERCVRVNKVNLLDSQKYPNCRTIPEHAFIVMYFLNNNNPLYSAKQIVLPVLSINLLKLIFFTSRD